MMENKILKIGIAEHIEIFGRLYFKGESVLYVGLIDYDDVIEENFRIFYNEFGDQLGMMTEEEILTLLNDKKVVLLDGI